MLPINRVLNCQRVLSSGKYQLIGLGNQYKGIEDIWLIKYLMEQGLSKKEIRERITPIHEAEYGYMPGRWYDEYYKKAQKTNLMRYGVKPVIYEDEFEKINHLRVPMLQKKFAVCVICYMRANGNKETNYGDLMTSGIKKFVEKKDHHDYSDFSRAIIAMRENDFFDVRIQETEIDYEFEYSWDDDGEELECGLVDRMEYVRLKDPVGEVKFTLDTLVDVEVLYDQRESLSYCEKCGKEYFVSKQCQRNLCLECWKEKESERLKKYDSEPICGKRICESCGKEFEITGRSKRNVCLECWKARERERIKLAVKKHRSVV